MDQDLSTVRHHIGGVRVDAASGRTFVKHTPWTGAVLARVAAGDAEDARAAVAAASAAFPQWAAAPPGRRQEIFLRAATLLHDRRDRVRRLLAAETGCGAVFAGVQLDSA
ncbi:aldehyde dehydrogenase family protein [Actinoplanes sp. DH11]|uniref:aldehyde dehydrogenase family protein n=1 Tax=Actinoplanes sp. DH11 TaxID=2857011 RepID=UPI0021037D67|nr:aldehyde dehydrogenase family protein [Actinoplanes sp. DH11]